MQRTRERDKKQSKYRKELKEGKFTKTIKGYK
jgi:hypothetical protein